LTASNTKLDPEPSSKRIAYQLPNDHWRAWEIAFWMLPVMAYFVFSHHMVIGSQILIVAMFAVSIDLILGYAGIISIGHAAFFGVGAYTATLLALAGWAEPISGMLLGGVLAACAGFPIGFLVVRGNDLTRILVTLGICFLLYEAANKASFLTGGADGLPGAPMWKVLGLFEFDLGGKTAYLYSLAVLFVVFVISRRLVNSPFGLSLRGLRESARRMPAIGAPVLRRQITIFVVSAGIAGLAGAMLAQTAQFVGLDSLSFSRSADLLIILALGGTGRLYGGLIGAAVFLLVQDYLSDINPIYWQFWIGLLLVLLVMFARGGILGGLDSIRERFARGRT
jgi:branched-chain amino acid transport system permease protein